VPVFIDSFGFYYKSLRDGFFLEIYLSPDDELSAILPFSPVTFSINNQEFDNLLFFYKEKKKEKCNVIAYSLAGKKYKAKINLWVIKSYFDRKDSINLEFENT
jgi:hypothetical protein